MNNENDKQLEAAVDNLLKSLPPLRAPDTLIPRVLATVAPEACLPWYRRTWQTWPFPLQFGSLAMALALGAGLYIGIGEAVYALRGTYIAVQLNSVLGALSAIHQVVTALASVGALVLQQRGTGWLVACSLLAALSYVVCIGLGTIFVRLAWARNSQKPSEI